MNGNFSSSKQRNETTMLARLHGSSLTCCAACARIAGNGASEKNLKDGVCAQFEKNFAKAKWRV